MESRTFIVWAWLLALGLLAGRGEAQSCTQDFGGPNLARGKPTSQSSTFELTGKSANAVNGKCDGGWVSHSCTHTENEFNPWWSVNLGREYAISVVVVKNRQDCCGDRIKGATIHVGHHMGDFGKKSIICGTITNIKEGSLSTILCSGAQGRYVTIVIPGREGILTLCEVEVHGMNITHHC